MEMNGVNKNAWWRFPENFDALLVLFRRRAYLAMETYTSDVLRYTATLLFNWSGGLQPLTKLESL